MAEYGLRGKAAIVTGASRRAGIGAAVCRALADEGVDVVFTYWTDYDALSRQGPDPDGPEALRREVEALGVRCVALEADHSLPETAAQVLDAAAARLGPPSILVNNAAHSMLGGYEELDAAALDAHYAVNVRGMALLSVLFARRYPGGPGGRIINLSSGQGVGPMPGELAYVASKGAVEAFTVSLAEEVSHKGITVNAVDPGATDTGWMDDAQRSAFLAGMRFGRLGTPEDAARLILFLASEAGGWVTGQVIHSRGA